MNYPDAYLRTIGKEIAIDRPLKDWPYAKGSKVKHFVFAGHRKMEGERAFTQELRKREGDEALAEDNVRVAYKDSLGGGFKTSRGWEPLSPAGAYETIGPRVEFCQDDGKCWRN